MHETDDDTELVVLGHSECLEHLRGVVLGRIGFDLDDVPPVVPVNVAVTEDGTVVFRTAATSVLAQVAGRSVVFEADGFDNRRRTGWRC